MLWTIATTAFAVLTLSTAFGVLVGRHLRTVSARYPEATEDRRAK